MSWNDGAYGASSRHSITAGSSMSGFGCNRSTGIGDPLGPRARIKKRLRQARDVHGEDIVCGGNAGAAVTDNRRCEVAESRLQLAETQLQRQRQLAAAGAISESSLDEFEQRCVASKDAK